MVEHDIIKNLVRTEPEVQPIVIPALRRQEEDHEFKDSLGYVIET